jgi:hypothetical protein
VRVQNFVPHRVTYKTHTPGLAYLHHLVSLVVTALISLACIALSLSLYKHYNTKTDLCILVIFPALCSTVSITACVHHYWSFPLLGSDFHFPYCVTHVLHGCLSLICQLFVFFFIRVFAKQLFPSASIQTCVALECIWTMCFVIFNLSTSYYVEKVP